VTRNWIAGAALALALAGCGNDSPDPLGAEPTPTVGTLAAACGHPGARVDYVTADLPVTIDYDDCDVSGVEFYVDDAMLGAGKAWHHSPNPDSENVAQDQRAGGCYSFATKDGWLGIGFVARACPPSPTTTTTP
jgi:hypothetical protein